MGQTAPGDRNIGWSPASSLARAMHTSRAGTPIDAPRVFPISALSKCGHGTPCKGGSHRRMVHGRVFHKSGKSRRRNFARPRLCRRYLWRAASARRGNYVPLFEASPTHSRGIAAQTVSFEEHMLPVRPQTYAFGHETLSIGFRHRACSLFRHSRELSSVPNPPAIHLPSSENHSLPRPPAPMPLESSIAPRKPFRRAE